MATGLLLALIARDGVGMSADMIRIARSPQPAESSRQLPADPC